MKKKKIIGATAACLLAGAMFAGGATAYLTDTDTATNTFTVGEVVIDTLEPNYPGNGSDEVTDLVSLEEVNKDPQIKNTGKNRAVVFMKVDIPMANVITAQENGKRNPKANTELFDFRTADGEYDSVHAEWILLDTRYLDDNGNDTGNDKSTVVSRLYGYSTVVDVDETTKPVFDVVRLANVIEEQVDNTTQDIVMTTYAIQAENIAGLTTADYDEEMNATHLSNIYQVYWNQSSEVVADDADTSNDKTLIDTTLNVTMTIANTHLKINTGDTADEITKATVKVAYTGTGTAPTFTLESSDTTVATVDNNGNIRAIGVGTATITATAKNPDTGKVVTATTTIQVTDVNSGE